MDSTIENYNDLQIHNQSIQEEFYNESDSDSDYDSDNNSDNKFIEKFSNSKNDNSLENFSNRNGGNWHLVCRQTLWNRRRSGYWQRANNWYLKNGTSPQNPNSPQYLMKPSDLDTNPIYKTNGKFRFMLKQYGPDSEELIWEQNINPFNASKSKRMGQVEGYRGIKIPYNQGNSNMFWGGLRYNGGPCLVSGSTQGWWFYALGSYQRWGNGIPNIFRNGNQAAKKVELYVLKAGPSGCNDDDNSCPKRCKICRTGGASDGGVPIINGVCTNNCSRWGFCGTSSAYVNGGTDCSKCITQALKRGSVILDSSLGGGKQFSTLGSYRNSDKFLKSLPLPFYLKASIPRASSGDHREIIYKRYTPLNGLTLSQTLTTNWFSSGRVNNNVFNRDFSLFSNMNDARADRNKWRFCNFNDPGVGFPRDCGKNRPTGWQWISTTRRGNVNNFPFKFYIMDWGSSQCLPPKPKYYSNGDKRIKKISVQCDDMASIYINSKLVKKISGWNVNHVINNPPSSKTSNVIAVDCTNLGGPGTFIATIELYNKSIIVTDNTWTSAQHPGQGYWTTPSFPENQNWTHASVNGQSNISGRYKGYVKNQNYYAHQIWSSTNINGRKCYLRKVIGADPVSAKCRIKLNNAQAKCYADRYPDLRKAFGNNLNAIKRHWNLYGCTIKENRSYKCVSPPQNVGNFTYQSCYNDRPYRAIPNYLGNVSNHQECANKAERGKYDLFGVQFYGQCFAGNDIDRAKMYGPKNNCGRLGTAWDNQLYKRNFPYPPPIPQLKESNFEAFQNKNEDINKYLKNYKQKYSIALIIIIGILILLYFHCKK